MEGARNTIVLVCVGLYMVICIIVGVWALRRTRSSRDFFMAGRDLGVFVTGIAVFSSTLSGFGFVGGPGLVYRMGMSSIWMVVCTGIGFSFSAILLAKRLRLFAELSDPVSLPDVVAVRYRSESARLMTAIAILLGVIGYLAAQIKAMATVLQDIVSRNSAIGDLSLATCVVISCAVLVFYCVTGGIIASVYTDLFQGLVMIVAAILVFVTAMHAFPGGFASMSETIMADDPAAMGLWGTLGVLGCLSWYFLFSLGGTGQPHIITKMMMNKRVRDARNIIPVSFLGYGLSALLWISIGLVMRALVLQGTHPSLDNPDQAAPQFLQTYAHPILSGVVFAGLFAAIMSTADGFLNIAAAAIVHDIPRAIWGKSLKRELLWARTATVATAVVAAAFCLMYDDLVALLGAFGWGTFAVALVPVVAIGFNWKRATALAANVSMAVGLVTIFTLKLGGINLPYHIDGGAVALVLSLTVFFGISLLSKPPKLDPDIEKVMEL